MTFTNERLNKIYDRTSGYCHICHKKVAFKNHGVFGARGAWEVEHSNPRAKGGTNRLNNLFPACISCNRSKQVASTRSSRAINGKTRAPLSIAKRKEAKLSNAVLGSAVGATIVNALAPGAGLLGAVFGACIGHKKNPDK